MIARADITGIILCGGEARRMHGVEKPLELLADKPLVAHVHDRLAPQVSRIVISANREALRYSTWGDTVVADTMPNCGPLGGLSAALDHVNTAWAFCCPGDAPFLDRALVGRLADALDERDADMALPSDGARPQHLFLFMRASLAVSLHDYLAAGERSVHGWVARCHAASIDASDMAHSFLNINTADELLRVEAEHLLHTHSNVERS